MTREGLGAKHGTAEEFWLAVWTSCASLFIYMEEARAAIARYLDEWAAGDAARSEDDQRPSRCSSTAS